MSTQAQSLAMVELVEHYEGELAKLRAECRERTQWQCKCGGTDCAGQAENERLRAELGPLREIVGVRCDAESTPSDITNWMNLVSHADAAKKLRARVAELEQALAPFATLDIAHAKSKPDEHPVFGINSTTIHYGDIRKARAAIDEARAGKGAT